jgi:ubiquinol-cytochrome c reductase cytochrome c1 subunit
MYLSKQLLASIALIAFTAPAAMAAGGGAHPLPVQEWAFDGVFGKFDKPAVQRGFQVYKEVCSACHGMKRVPFRKLQEIGFSEAEVKALAASYQIKDGPNDNGEMFERPGRPSDRFPPTYANDNAGRAANNGALPPDFSLIVKARTDGANYIYALLTGYEAAPEGFEVPAGAHYNKYFPGNIIKMAKPLNDDQVTYQDDTKATLDQQAHDVVNFLQWAAEPEMEMRKRMGIKVMIFLAVMTGIFYAVKKRIWKDLH